MTPASDDDDDDDAQFIEFVRAHRRSGSAASFGAARDDESAKVDDESDEDDGPRTPVRVTSLTTKDADAIVKSARESARKAMFDARVRSAMKVARETRTVAAESAEALRASGAKTSASSAVRREISEDDALGVTDFQSAGRALDFYEGDDAAQGGRGRRRVSLTPPRALSMTTSPIAGLRDRGIGAGDNGVNGVELRTVTETVVQAQNGTAVKEAAAYAMAVVEIEVQTLRAKVAALQRELETSLEERDRILSERLVLVSAVTSAEQERETATTKMAQMEIRAATLMRERDDVAAELAKARAARDVDEESSDEAAKMHISKLEFALSEKSIEIARMQTIMDEMGVQVRASSSTVEKLESRLAAATTQLESAQAQLEQSKTTNATNDAQTKTFKSDIDRLTSTLTSTNEKLAKVTSELHDARAQIKARSDDVDGVNEENERLRADIDRLNGMVTLTNSTMSQKDALVDQMREEVAKAVEERDEARDALAAALHEASTKDRLHEVERRAKEQIEVTLEEVRAALRTKTGECASAESSLSTLRVEIEELRTKLEKESRRAMTTEEKALSAKEAFAARLSAAADKQQSFHGRMLEMKSQIDEEKKLIEAKARASVDEISEQLATVKQQLVDKEKAFLAASKRATNREAELEKVYEDLNNAKNALLELKSKTSEDAIARQEITSLLEELADAKNQAQRLEAAQSMSSEETKAAKRQVEALEGKIAGLEAAADLAASESEELRKKLDIADKDAQAVAEDNELASSMAAQALNAAQAKIIKLDKHIVGLNSEIAALKEKNSLSREADQDSIKTDFVELHKKCEASDRRVRELSAETKTLEAAVAKERRAASASEMRANAEAEARAEVEAELEDMRTKVATAESRVGEVNAELVLLEKQLEKEKRKPDARRSSGAGDLKAMTASRDAAIRRAKDLQADLAKVTNERELLQEAMANLEKRLEYERTEFAKQLREAVMSAVKAKDEEVVEIRKQLNAMREMSMGGESVSANLSRAYEAKQQELASAQSIISGLKGDMTSLQHQLEHANATVLAERRRLMASSQSDSELAQMRDERDAAKKTLSDTEHALSEALAAKSWLEGSIAATEEELIAAKKAAAAATAMSEQARAQITAISRQQGLSPKLLTSPTRRSTRPFGSPMLDAQLASPLKWFSRRVKTPEMARTPSNNLFNKFASTTMPTPTMPMRTPGGSWRAPSRPETAAEAVAALIQFLVIVLVCIACMVFLVAVSPVDVDSPLYTNDASTMRMYVRSLKKTITLAVPTSDGSSCGSMKQRFKDGILEISHALIGRHYRSMCVRNFPS